MALTPDGKSAYVTNSDRTISQYNINPTTGKLHPKSPATVAARYGPGAIAVSPGGKSAYVLDGNAVSQYSINPTTGKLSSKSPAKVATGKSPQEIASAPTARAPTSPIKATTRSRSTTSTGRRAS